jgi:hypothetical protein
MTLEKGMLHTDLAEAQQKLKATQAEKDKGTQKAEDVQKDLRLCS